MHARALSALLRRLVAAGCAALVLALTIFAASPAAHAALHEGDHHHHHHHHDDDGAAPEEACAVELFANGVALAVGPAAPLPPRALIGGVTSVTAAEIFLVSPRWLRQPERGPPPHRIA
jgi:hypothetical protein